MNQEVIKIKELRVNLDEQLQLIKQLESCREVSLVATKIQEAIMWLGMDLKRLNTPNPYPQSYNTDNDIISPTADNLKL